MFLSFLKNYDDALKLVTDGIVILSEWIEYFGFAINQ